VKAGAVIDALLWERAMRAKSRAWTRRPRPLPQESTQQPIQTQKAGNAGFLLSCTQRLNY